MGTEAQHLHNYSHIQTKKVYLESKVNMACHAENVTDVYV